MLTITCPAGIIIISKFIPWETKCKEAHVLGDTKLEVAGQGFKLRKYDFQI